MKYLALITAALLSNTAIAAAADEQVLATQNGASVTANDMKVAVIGAEPGAPGTKFGSLQSAKDALTALLTTKLFARNGQSVLAATPDEKTFLEYTRERTQLEAALALVERRERAKATADKVSVEARAREFYDSKPDGFKVPAKTKVSHILFRVDSKRTLIDLTTEAEKVAKLARDGTPWQTLVDAYSDDLKSKAKGGELGEFYENSSDHPMVVAAYRTRIDKDIADPVLSRNGVHVVKILGREPARRAGYDEVKDKLVEAVIEERMTAAKQKFIADLKKGSEPVFYDAAIDHFVEKDDPAIKARLKEIQDKISAGTFSASDFSPTPAQDSAAKPPEPKSK